MNDFFFSINIWFAQRTLSGFFDASQVTAKLKPTFISKVNTAVQLLTIGVSLGAPIWLYVGEYPVLNYR